MLPMISSLFNKLILDYLKDKIDPLLRPNWETILEKTAIEIERKYKIVSKTDLRNFLAEPNVEKYFENHLETGEIDYKYLAEIFKDYVLAPGDQSIEAILNDFFIQFQANLASEPKLRDLLYLRQHQQQLSGICSLDSKAEKILQILEEDKSPSIEPGNILNLKNYFYNTIEKLKDPRLNHYVSLDTKGNLKISIEPKCGQDQVEYPFHGTLAFKFKKDGEILNFDDMLEKAYRTGIPIIIDSRSLIEFSANYGDIPLIEDKDNIEFIKIEAMQPDPIRISVPGCHIQYDIILKRDEPGTIYTFAVSNKFQDLPVKFKFEYNLSEGGLPTLGKLSIHKEIREMDVKQGLDLSEFILAASRNGFFFIENKGKNKSVRLPIRVQGIEPDPQAYIDALRKLAFIQELTEIRILCPSVLSANELAAIDDIISYFQTGKIENGFDSSLTTSIGTKEAIAFLDAVETTNGEISGIIESFKNAFFVINGAHIPVGDIEKHYPPMRTKKTVKELRDQLKFLKKDALEIDLIPIGGLNTIIYSKSKKTILAK